MKGFFSLDNKFMTAMSKLFDAIVLSLLWFFGSLPILTMAAATNAAYETMQLCILRDKGSLLAVFWKAYKRRFLEGIGQSAVFSAVVLPTVLLIIWGNMQEETAEWLGAALLAMCIFSLIAVQTAIYTFALMRSTDQSFGRQLAVSFVLGIRNAPVSLLLVGILAAACVILDVLPYLAIIIPAGVIWVYGRFLEKIAKKYPQLCQRTDFAEEI